MKSMALLFAALIGALPFAGIPDKPAHAASDNGAAKVVVDKAEEAAARVPLENYIKGQETGNGDYIRKAFHPDARVMAFRDGKLLNLSAEEFASRFAGKPAPDEAQRKRRIASLEVTGTAAVGKIVLEYPTVTFTDYMSLLKVDGEWKIVNKAFHAEPKAKN